MLPIRCFRCGKVIGDKEQAYSRLSAEFGKKIALDRLGIKRMCCRMVMLTTVAYYYKLADYEEANKLKPPNDSSEKYVTVHNSQNTPKIVRSIKAI